MNYIYQLLRYYFILFFIYHASTAFTPDTSDYDAYGIKIAMNEQIIVLAQNDQLPPTFFIQFGPYNNSQSTQCSLTYPNTTNTFMYTVAMGKKQKQNQTRFFFAGELTNDQSGPFIGVAIYDNNNTDLNISDTSSSSSSSCDTNFTYSLQYLENYEHQEYYILGVDPIGILAYGFTNEFVFVFDSTNTTNFNIWNGNITWLDSTFIPHAVDISDNFGVVAGFTRNAPNSTVKYSPMIYLINFNSSNNHQPVIVDKYKPIPGSGTWQDLLTNADADVYSAKYDMSVSIDKKGSILVGMQFINRVFLLSVNITKPTNFTYINRYTNGRSLGNGKSVAWFDNGIAAVLINVYTLSYQWSLSQIFFFDIYRTGYNSTTVPLSVFPNSHQLLPSSFSSIFLNVVSSSSSLALLDNIGNIMIFSPTQPGSYPSTQDTGLMPIFTAPSVCIPGSYKDRAGVHDCVLCPMGTKNPGNSNTSCVSCASDSFCPLGSVADIPPSALQSLFQVVPYPISPESVIFDDILLQNMFLIRSGRCIVVSPLFWALIVAGLLILVIIIMEVLTTCVKHARSKRLTDALKSIFMHTDLIGEGEFWIGGLVSFSILVLVCYAYGFSNAYLKQYPIEGSSPSYFACDTTMRNAKFETNIQSLAIPITDEEKEMFNLLNNQVFTLNIDFINTLIGCNAVSIEALFGLIWTTIRWLDCNNVNNILTLTISLPYQQVSVRITVDDINTIGGLRIGLSSPGHTDHAFTLEELHFYQAFSKNGYLLSQTLPVAIAITKIINETKPMVGEESDYGGIYVPTFTVDNNSLFLTNGQYITTESTLTILTIAITETPYYVKNLQEPIARQPEIIFRNLLFTVVCLEIVGLVFLFYVLLFKPLYKAIVRKCRTHKEPTLSNETKINGDLLYAISSTKIGEIDNDRVTSTF